MRPEDIEARRVRVLRLVAQGKTVGEIAGAVGANVRNVRGILKRHGWVAPNGRQGGVWTRGGDDE